MKRITVIVLFVLLLSCQPPCHESRAAIPNFVPPENALSILVYGQSNSVSQSTTQHYGDHIWMNDYYGEYSTPRYQGNEMVKVDAAHPLRSGTSWIYLSDMIYAATGKDVVVYNLGYGGRSSSQLKTAQYINVVYDTLSQHPEIEYVLYVQGESDVGFNTWTTFDNLTYMISHTKVCNNGVQWYVAKDGLGNAAVRTAQQWIVDTGFALAGPDIDALRYPDYHDVDLEDAKLLPHAEAWLNILLSSIGP